MNPHTAVERLSPGEQIDDFLVWEPIHIGAQGILYRTTGRDIPFPLLMKVPRFQTGEPAESLLSFETEAMILPALTGSHVPRFVAAGDLSRMPYLVLEHVEGCSLESRLEDAPMPPAEVARIGAAVADAIHSLHRQDAVHCDLKPDNVILRPDGEAVLIDFGFSWHARFPDLFAEEERFAAGSAPYLSPEQILGVRGDPRSDIFSLGVILYEMATGELPFGMPNSEGGLRQRLWDDPDPPALLEPGVTPVLQEIILRCLEPQAENRYRSAAHVAFDLRNPAQVPLTARATRMRAGNFFARAGRWWKAHVKPLEAPVQVKRAIHAAPVIMVAVDTTHASDERQPAILQATRNMLTLSDEYRLVCVAVVAAPPLGSTGAEGDSALHVEHMTRLRSWTAPLGLPMQRLSLHVVVAGDAASALVEFARRNQVDLIVLGAPRPKQQPLAWMRSVASGVTANAHCSGHGVRVPGRPPLPPVPGGAPPAAG
jgi:eukaryotic-like serine/threonine-protein kinase